MPKNPSSEESHKLSLRSRITLWEREASETSPVIHPERHFHTDIVIVGAGITGAFLAERFSRAGRQVVVVDRHEPQHASTAASTALLQWEIDAPMLELEDSLGFEAASSIYRRSFATVRSIGALVAQHRFDCGFDWRDTLYLAGNELDPADLREEERLRRLAELPSHYLEAADLSSQFGLRREGALHSRGSAQANPMELARLLLNMAIARGARVISPARVVDYDCTVKQVNLRTSEGVEIHGEILILANGYEMPPFVASNIHRIVSTWALATHPQPSAVWPSRALIWEASTPYLYMRSTPDNRIIVGGEDEEISDASARDALTTSKGAALLSKLQSLLPQAKCELDLIWAGFFGETEDGLPLIGRVPNRPRCYGAFGYGGNGITFSALAAEMLERLVKGQSDPHEILFAIDR